MEKKKDSGCGMYVFAAITVIVISFYAGYSYGGSDKNDEIRKEVMVKKEVEDANNTVKAYSMLLDKQMERNMIISERKRIIILKILDIMDAKSSDVKKREYADLIKQISGIDEFN